MSDSYSLFPLPTYTFMLKDGSGSVFLRAGNLLALPLFTSEENADLYRTRTATDCVIIRIESADHLESYVTNPPSRAPGENVEFIIMVDPIDSDTKEYITFKRDEFLSRLRQIPRTILDLSFPVFQLVAEDGTPFAMPAEGGSIWPVFSVKDNAESFIVGTRRVDLLIAECDTAQRLLATMMSSRTADVAKVWSNDRVVDANSITFDVRLPVGEFLAALNRLGESS